MIKKIFYTVMLMFLASQLYANDAQDLTQTMKEKVEYITTVLADKTTSKDIKNNKIRKETNALFDYTLMARLSVGKKAYKSLDTKKREEYIDIFMRYFESSYIDKLHLYTDEEIIVEDARQTKTTRIQVPVTIKDETTETKMLYKFHHSKKTVWIIYDVEIAGVSILQTYRAQFAEILKTKTVIELIEQLKSSKSS